jgi:hypothetical protein
MKQKFVLVFVVCAAFAIVHAQPAPAPKSQVRPGAPVESSPLPKLPPLAPLFDYPLRDTSRPSRSDADLN